MRKEGPLSREREGGREGGREGVRWGEVGREGGSEGEKGGSPPPPPYPPLPRRTPAPLSAARRSPAAGGRRRPYGAAYGAGDVIGCAIELPPSPRPEVPVDAKVLNVGGRAGFRFRYGPARPGAGE